MLACRHTQVLQHGIICGQDCWLIRQRCVLSDARAATSHCAADWAPKSVRCEAKTRPHRGGHCS